MPKQAFQCGWRRWKLKQKEVATILGVVQPKVPALLRGRLEGFSSDRLFRFLNALDRNIEIVIRPTKKRSGAPKIRVLPSLDPGDVFGMNGTFMLAEANSFP